MRFFWSRFLGGKPVGFCAFCGVELDNVQIRTSMTGEVQLRCGKCKSRSVVIRDEELKGMVKSL